MHRCKESAGQYRISLRIINEPEPTRVQIHGHRDIVGEVDGERTVVEPAPFVDTDAPFEGELCVHEIAWLTGRPGVEWRRDYEWTIERLDGALDTPRRVPRRAEPTA